MKKWIKYLIISVITVVFFRVGSWPVDKEPAPSLSLASAWVCEQFANGIGIGVERKGLKVAAINPRYDQYRIDFCVNGAWQIRASISALILLSSYMLLTGRFTGFGILAALMMIVFFHIVRLMALAVFSLVEPVAWVDTVTRFGYIICTALSMLSVLNLRRFPEFRMSQQLSLIHI